MRRYFEDYKVGSSAEFGAIAVTAEEIVAFAQRYDPQPFHLAGADESSPYGGLIASGWHTSSMAMRVMVDEVIDGETVPVRLHTHVNEVGTLELWCESTREGDARRWKLEYNVREPSET